MDVRFLRRIVKSIQQSPLAGKRVGHEWQPTGSSVMRKQSADDSFFDVETLQVLDDVCTKWCTRTFFPDSHTRLNFVSSVFSLYTTLSTEFDDLHFDLVFKGGVIMRLLILEFLNDFPMDVRVAAEQYLQREKALSFSDFDFEIVPRNPSAKQDVIIRLFSLDYAVLLWLRNVMDSYSSSRESNPLVDFSWDPKQALEDLKESLQNEVDGLDEMHPLHKATIDHVVRGCYDKSPPKGYKTGSGKSTQTKRDNVVIFHRKGETERSVMNACDYFTQLDVPGVPCEYPRDFYCTMNTFIGADTPRERSAQLKSVFHLCRIKQGFVVYLTTKSGDKRCERLGGEVLDLSQSHGTKVDEMRRYIYSRMQEPYRTYYIIGSDFHIRSYSANGLFHDLRVQIHFQAEVPFEFIATDSKLRKRMLRYVLFMVIYTLGPFVDHPFEEKVKQLNKLVQTTSSLDHLYRYKRSGIRPIDDFVTQEQRTLGIEGSLKQKKAYLATIHRHLRTISTWFMTNKNRPHRLYMDERYLEFADTFLY